MTKHNKKEGEPTFAYELGSSLEPSGSARFLAWQTMTCSESRRYSRVSLSSPLIRPEDWRFIEGFWSAKNERGRDASI